MSESGWGRATGGPRVAEGPFRGWWRELGAALGPPREGQRLSDCTNRTQPSGLEALSFVDLLSSRRRAEYFNPLLLKCPFLN